MDFQINIQTDFELQAEQFLHILLERGYAGLPRGGLHYKPLASQRLHKGTDFIERKAVT